MNHHTAAKHKLRNLGHTLLLIGGMSLLLVLCSELLFGEGVWVFFGVALLMFALPDVSPHWILRLYQARYLYPQESPQLTLLMQELARRSELEEAPALYWIPSRMVNVFAVGARDRAVIAITDGLLQMLSLREFDADLEAARITGDPEGLASALGKIAGQGGNLWQRILFPGYRNPEPSLLRTHPDTDERISRLLELGGGGDRLAYI
jgi:Zn-dependent protease with chaperone function